MATVSQVYGALIQQAQTATGSLSPAPQIAMGWPPLDAIQGIAQGGAPILSFYDAAGSRDTTRWPNILAIPDSTITTGLVATLSATAVQAGQHAALTLSGAPLTDDTVVLSDSVNALTTEIASYTATAQDTLTTIAAALTTQINTLSNVSATSSGPVITVTAGVLPVVLSTGTSNQGTRTIEFKRIERHARVILWTNSENDREKYGDPIDSLLGQLYAAYGFQTADQEWVKLHYDRDQYLEDPQLQDIYRRDFYVTLEYGVTGADTTWPVLAAKFAFTPSNIAGV